jgi:hypothetical protein
MIDAECLPSGLTRVADSRKQLKLIRLQITQTWTYLVDESVERVCKARKT